MYKYRLDKCFISFLAFINIDTFDTADNITSATVTDYDILNLITEFVKHACDKRYQNILK